MRSSQAFITVTCDKCNISVEDISLTATAGGGYDERNVDGDLKSLGWKVDNKDICEDCSKEENNGLMV